MRGWRPLFFIGSLLVSVCAAVLADQRPPDSAALVEADAPSLWCTSIDHHLGSSPPVGDYGAIVAVRDRFFRVCKPPSEGSSPERRVTRLFFNADRVAGLQTDLAMSSLMLNGIGLWSEREERLISSTRKVGEIKFGDTRYEVRRLFDALSGKLVGRGTFRYARELNQDQDPLPSHHIVCGKLDFTNQEITSCHIIVGYKELTGLKLEIAGGSFFDPFPFNEIPRIAADIYRILETSDVTAEVEELLQYIPMLE